MKKNNLPTISNYGNYSSSNYGAHCIKITIPASRKNKHGITIYYSYNTCVAFRGYIDSNNYGLFVRKNEWGNTTGKHLNYIDGGSKDTRLNEKKFAALFNKALKNA